MMMKFNVSLLCTALSLISSPSSFFLNVNASPHSSSHSSSSFEKSQAFFDAMKRHSIEANRKQALQKLQSNILQRAVPVPSSDTDSSDFSNLRHHNRDLANNNYYNNKYYNNNVDDEYSNYGFSISSYSLKYSTCSTISTFSSSNNNNNNNNNQNSFKSQQYVIFRLCPSSTCSKQSTTGCMSNYGEYMIPLYDWLYVIAQYREEEMERYCNYCQSCVNDKYYGADDDGGRYGKNGGGSGYYGGGDGSYVNNGNKYYNMGDLDDQYYFNRGDNNANGNDRNLQADDDDAAAGDDGGNNNANNNNNNGGNYDCSYKSACKGYYDVCNNENAVEWAQFFQCKKVNYNNQNIYIGPHCKSDKKTITLAVFEDKYCTEYAGSQYDLATITDDLIQENSLEEYYRSDCISCKETDLPFQSYNDANDNNDISEVCENLYSYAAKCNRHFYSATSASYTSYQQANNELSVCSYISSVVTGSYDENGYIYIDANEYHTDNKYNEFAAAARRRDVVTLWQGFGLALFALVLGGLSIQAALLRRQVEQKLGFDYSTREPLGRGSARSRSGKAGSILSRDIERSDSGIMACRSRSTVSSTNDYTAPSGKFV